MRAATFLVLTLVVACRARTASLDQSTAADSLDPQSPEYARDSILRAPRVVDGPTVIVFWLAAADSLNANDQAAALDDLTYYTDRVAPMLTRHDIKLVPTNADTVYVALPNNQRRPILLSGVDYPFGYMLVSPGSAERILAGVYSDEELLDEIETYFDLPPSSDSTATRARVST